MISPNESAPQPVVSKASPRTLRLGDEGPEVRVLQTVLNGKGFNCGAVDAKFGPKTQAAVMAFQRSQGLAADGVVGPKTWAALSGGPSTAQGTAEAFVQKALAQKGDRYVFGAEASPSNPNPSAFDCSELVQWAAAQVGVGIPDGTMNQLPHIQRAGKAIPVARGISTRGALLFRPGHVAISLGDGRTIEARGRAYGVGIFSAHKRGWTAAGLIPGMRY